MSKVDPPRRRASNSSVFILAALGLAAASSAETREAESPSAPPLRLVVNESLPSLDPFAQRTQIKGWILQGNVYEALVGIEEGEPVPLLAKSWRQEDERTWVFELRDDVEFHDGRRLAAADVVASIERARFHPTSRIADSVGAVERVRARGETAVEVVLAYPAPRLAHRMASVPIVAGAAAEGELGSLVATGPYRVVSFSQGEQLRVERFPGYWRSLPPTAEATFIVEIDAARRVRMLLDGEADLVTSVPPELIDDIEGRGDLWLASSLGGMIRLILINTRRTPLDDPRVREALDLAVDREALANDYYKHYARPAGQLAEPGAIGHARSIVPPARDLEKARRLVAEVSAGEPLDVPLFYTEGSTVSAEMLIRQLEEAGFRLERNVLPWGELYSRLMKRETALVFASWNNAPGDVGPAFESIIHSSRDDSPLGRSNVSGYANAEVDRLVEESSRTADRRRRQALLEKAAAIVAAERPLIPLVWSMNLYGIKRNLEWEPPPSGSLQLSQMSLGEVP